MAPDHVKWYAELLQAGLDTKLFSEADILAQAAPAVLVRSLPKEVLTRLLAAGITTGTVTPISVLEIATAEVLAANVARPLLWTCVATAAERAGVTRPGRPVENEAARREFFRRGLAAALATQVLTPVDVIGHVDAAVLVEHFPDDLNTKLLETGLAAGKLDAAMIVDVMGTHAIAAHAPPPVLWACLAQAGERAPGAIERSATTEPTHASRSVASRGEPERAAAPPPAPRPLPPMIGIKPPVESKPPVVEVKPLMPSDEVKPPPALIVDDIDLVMPVDLDVPPVAEAPVAVADQVARKSGLFGRLKRGST
jgi:hypothetical protein